MIFDFKLTGALFIAAACSLYGIFSADKLYKREKELSALLEAVRKLKNSFIFENREILDLLPMAFKNAAFLEIKGREINIKHTNLNKEDMALLTEFIKNCGRGIRNEEIKKCDSFEAVISIRQKGARAKAAQNARIMITAGICVGIGAAIIII